MLSAVYLILLVVFIGVIFADSVDAAELVSNLNRSTSPALAPQISSSQSLAQLFTTGNNPAGYVIREVKVPVFQVLTPGNSVRVSVYTNNSGNLGTLLFNLTGGVTSSGDKVFTSSGDFVLNASTTYFLYIPYESASFKVRVTSDNGEDSDSAAGWSIGDGRVAFSGNHVSGYDFNDLTKTVYSEPVKLGIYGAVANSPAEGKPVINGTVQVGQTLRVDVSGITDVDGINSSSLRYQWVRVDGSTETDILGATNSTYRLVSADVGKKLKVKVSFIDNGGFSEGPLVSDEVASVLVSNLYAGSGSNVFVGGAFGRSTSYMQQFTTGSHAPGYIFDGIVIRVTRAVGSAVTPVLSVYNSNGAALGSTRLYDLNGSVRSTGDRFFSAPAGAVLNSSTSYFLNVTSTLPNYNAGFRMGVTDSDDDSGGAGWSVGDNHLYLSSFRGSSWLNQNESLYIAVHGREANSVATGKPEITGRVVLSGVLTADTSGISDVNGVPAGSFVYQWVRVNGSEETNISGANESTYTVVDVDVGKRLKVVVSFVDSLGVSEGPLASDATVTVPRAGSASAITLVDNFDFSLVPDFAIPNITDTVYVSQEFTTGNHTRGYEIESISLNLNYTHSLSGFSVSIHDVSSDVPGVKLYQLYGPASRTGRQSFSASSGAVIVLDANTKYFVVLSASASPRIARVYFSNSTSESVSVDGWSIADEYVASTDGGNNWTSNVFTQFPVVINVAGSRVTNLVASGKPVINGTVQVGQTLTVDTSGIRDQDGIPSSFTYQWVRVDSGTETDILGATGSTYTVVSDDRGKRLKVKVSFIDTGGFSEGPLASDATALVTVPVNNPPVFRHGSSFSANENSVAVGTVVASDSDVQDSVTAYTLGGADRNSFSITSGGVLTLLSAPDYESPADVGGNNVYDMIVTAYSGQYSDIAEDNRVRTAARSITVTVLDVDEPPSVPSALFLSSPSSTSLFVSWSALGGTGPSIIDYDVGYGLSSSGPFTDWQHSDASRSATITGLNASTLYYVRVLARNAEGSSGWSPAASFTTVSAVNTPPVFSSSSSFSVNENTFVVGTVVASDNDSQDSVTGYRVSGGADSGRLLVRNGDLLVFRFAPDYEAPVDSGGDNVYNFVVTATSGTGGRVRTATHSITVTVNDVAEPPSVPSAPVLSSPSSTSLLVSWSAPSNKGPAISDYDVGYGRNSNGPFTDWSHSDASRRATITGLNASTLYYVRVLARNAEGSSSWSPTASFTTGSTSPPLVTNDPPVFSSSSSFSVSENAVSVGTVVASDRDSLDSVSGYSVSGGVDSALFSITNSGVLTFNSAPDYESPADSGGNNVYNLVVTASSGAGGRVRTATQSISVTVNDVDESVSVTPPQDVVLVYRCV